MCTVMARVEYGGIKRRSASTPSFWRGRRRERLGHVRRAKTDPIAALRPKHPRSCTRPQVKRIHAGLGPRPALRGASRRAGGSRALQEHTPARHVRARPSGRRRPPCERHAPARARVPDRRGVPAAYTVQVRQPGFDQLGRCEGHETERCGPAEANTPEFGAARCCARTETGIALSGGGILRRRQGSTRLSRVVAFGRAPWYFVVFSLRSSPRGRQLRELASGIE
jgi:hypothetical protein